MPWSGVQCSAAAGCALHQVVSLGRISPRGHIFSTKPTLFSLAWPDRLGLATQTMHHDRRRRSWNSRYLYQNAFVASCSADCQPHIRLFACSAWLLMPPFPTALVSSHLHSYRTLIKLNLSNLRCNYQKSPLLHKRFSHLSFLYA